jgi:hypothetical protein
MHAITVDGDRPLDVEVYSVVKASKKERESLSSCKKNESIDSERESRRNSQLNGVQK